MMYEFMLQQLVSPIRSHTCRGLVLNSHDLILLSICPLHLSGRRIDRVTMMPLLGEAKYFGINNIATRALSMDIDMDSLELIVVIDDYANSCTTVFIMTPQPVLLPWTPIPARGDMVPPSAPMIRLYKHSASAWKQDYPPSRCRREHNKSSCTSSTSSTTRCRHLMLQSLCISTRTKDKGIRAASRLGIRSYQQQ